MLPARADGPVVLPGALLLLAAACALQPDYAGVPCLPGGVCPAGFYCEPATGHCETEPAVDPCTVDHGGCSDRAACTSLGPRVSCTCQGAYLGDGGTCALDEAALGDLVIAYDGFYPGISGGPRWWQALLEPPFRPEAFEYQARVPADALAVGLWLGTLGGPSSSVLVNGLSVPNPLPVPISYPAEPWYQFTPLPAPALVVIDVTSPSGAQHHRYTVKSLP